MDFYCADLPILVSLENCESQLSNDTIFCINWAILTCSVAILYKICAFLTYEFISLQICITSLICVACKKWCRWSAEINSLVVGILPIDDGPNLYSMRVGQKKGSAWRPRVNYRFALQYTTVTGQKMQWVPTHVPFKSSGMVEEKRLSHFNTRTNKMHCQPRTSTITRSKKVTMLPPFPVECFYNLLYSTSRTTRHIEIQVISLWGRSHFLDSLSTNAAIKWHQLPLFPWAIYPSNENSCPCQKHTSKYFQLKVWVPV